MKDPTDIISIGNLWNLLENAGKNDHLRLALFKRYSSDFNKITNKAMMRRFSQLSLEQIINVTQNKRVAPDKSED